MSLDFPNIRKMLIYEKDYFVYFSVHIVNRMEEHISTVKALCPIPIGGAESILLLSGGGRASLKAWTVHKGTCNIRQLNSAPC